jgi:YHS domain-containing protein
MDHLSRRKVLGGLAVLCFAASARPAAAQAKTLAIRGYDPVAYFTLGNPVRGLPEFEYEWDEQRYLFSRAEHRDLFKANPVRYAPEFSGFCAASLTRGEVEEANPEYWLISDGKLYLFGKPIGPRLFQQDLVENRSKAEANRTLIRKH